MTVRGPNGATWHLRHSRLLSDLPRGVYEIEPRDVWSDGLRYVATSGTVTLTLDGRGSATVPITYVDAATSAVHGDPSPQAIRPGSRTFHVDCLGDDSASGLWPDDAFRSLDRAAALELEPGDRVLLRRGCRWRGPLVVNWLGTIEWPIVLGAYGEGSMPMIHDADRNNVDVYGRYLIIEHVATETSAGTVWRDPNCADQPVGWRTGFTVQHEAHHVEIRHVSAVGHTAGIHLTHGASHNRITNNELRDNVLMSVNTDDGGFDDSGAWGLLLNGSDNVIAYNRFSGNRAWCSYDFGNEGAAIEIYEAVRNSIHHNVSIDDITFSELGGSDRRRAADNVLTFNVFRSSLSGAEFLVVRGAGAHFGPTPGTRAFHNTVYLSHPVETEGVVCYAGCGPDILELRNNIIWVEWKGLYADAPFAESNNLFWRADGRPLLQFFGTANGLSDSSLVADPWFTDLAGGDLRLADGSPAIGAGTALDLSFGRDIAGVLLAGPEIVDLGAHHRYRDGSSARDRR